MLASIDVITILQSVPDVSHFFSLCGEGDEDEGVVGDIGLCCQILFSVSDGL